MSQAGGTVVADKPVLVGFFGRLANFIDYIDIWVMKIFEWNSPILMVLIVFEVVLRYLFNAPTIWGMDMQTFLSAGGRVVGIGYATMVHSQITMDLFVANASFRKKQVIDIINHTIFELPFMTALTYITWERMIEAFKYKVYIQSVWRPQISPIMAFIVGSYLLLSLQLLSELIKNVINLKRGNDRWLKRS